MFKPVPLVAGADFFVLESGRGDKEAEKTERELGVGAAVMGVKRLPEVLQALI
jgi:hypothetical protein